MVFQLLFFRFGPEIDDDDHNELSFLLHFWLEMKREREKKKGNFTEHAFLKSRLELCATAQQLFFS